jgi:phage shock protein E
LNRIRINVIQKITTLIVLFCASCGAALASEPAIYAQTIWIDVRTVTEYESGHLPGARNIGFEGIGKQISNVTTDKNTVLRLYCRSGRRSSLAKQTLERVGYTNVVNAGGLNDVISRTQLQPVIGADCIANEC